MSDFDRLCALLGPCLGVPTVEVAPTIAAWPPLLRLAHRHLISPLLSDALDRAGLSAPGEGGELLSFLRRANAERNGALRQELLAIVRRLNGAGIEPILLKGTIRLVDGLYPEPAWRFLRDLDLLVPVAALAEARAVLEADGYAATHDEWDPLHHHLPPLERPGAHIKVELHWAVAPLAWRHLVDADAIRSRAIPMVCEGVRLRVPSPADQLLHLASHRLMFHGSTLRGDVQLRDLVEGRLLMGRHPEMDIDALGLRPVARRCVDTFRLLVHRCFPMPAPGVSTSLPSRFQAAWLHRAQRSQLLLGAAQLAGFYVHGVHKVLCTSPSRAHLARRLQTAGFYRRRWTEAMQLVGSLRT